MTLDDVRDLCAEHGFVDNGGYDALGRWLRDKLDEVDNLQERVVELEIYAETAGDCDACGTFETENERLRKQVAAVRRAVESDEAQATPAGWQGPKGVEQLRR